MRRILIEFPGHGDGALFDAGARDAVLEPFIRLRERLRTAGYELLTADDHPVEGCERILFWDFYDDPPDGAVRGAARAFRRRLRGDPPRRSLFRDVVRAGMQERAVLFTGEPPVVWPRNWSPEVHAAFSCIFTWNDRYVDGRRYRKFHWPITATFPETLPVPFAEKKLLVNISANKSSEHPQELYSDRVAAIRHFEERCPDAFDLFGVGWETGHAGRPFPSYRGTVPHKWEVFPRYRFAICYENMRDEPGWITEKIFDCMRADCVPVYLGASNVEDYVDPGAFVDRRRFGSDAELADHLLSMDAGAYERHRAAMRGYLEGERFARFLSPAFCETVLRGLGLAPAMDAGSG